MTGSDVKSLGFHFPKSQPMLRIKKDGLYFTQTWTYMYPQMEFSAFSPYVQVRNARTHTHIHMHICMQIAGGSHGGWGKKTLEVTGFLVGATQVQSGNFVLR